MIEKRKIVICNFCRRKALMETVGEWDFVFDELPDGWKQIDKKIHYCPECCFAIEELKHKFEAKEKKEG